MREGTQVECIICFEPLCDSPVAVLRKRDRRSCRHFFHRHCADACPVARGCPLCRAEYSEIYTVPSWSSQEAWFATMDIANTRCLTLQELCEAIIATVPVNSCALEAMLPTLLAARGKRLEEAMSFQDLFGPDGLLLDLQESMRLLPAGVINQRIDACPDFKCDKRAWFEYWDTDRSGVLEREEVVRGLVKSFKSDVSSRLCKKRLRMRYLVEEMWPLVDFDGNGRISVDEFCRKDGLADLILRNFKAKSSPRCSPRLSRVLSPTRVLSPRLTRAPSPTESRTVSRRGVERNGLAARAKTWPDVVIDDIPEDKPSLIHRASLGFNPRTLEDDSTPTADDSTPTSSSGLPSSWSVLARRKSIGSNGSADESMPFGHHKSLPADAFSSSTPTSVGSLRRSNHAKILGQLLERPRSPQASRHHRSSRSKSKEASMRVKRILSSDIPVDRNNLSKSKEPVGRVSAHSAFIFNTAPT
jgi:hypothetical protein